MKKFIHKLVLAAAVLCLAIATAVPTAFAADTTYVLSFRPGAYGSFSGAAVSYLSQFGEVEQSSTGNLFLQVQAGTQLPSDLETQLRSFLQPDAGYYYRSGLSARGTADEDATYVAEYGVLQGSGYAYTVRYVDSVSGSELAESYTGYANAGDEVIFQAKVLDGYTVDQGVKSLTIYETENQVITFSYTANAVAGEDVVQTTTVTVPAGVATVTTDNAAVPGADAADGDNTGDATPVDNGEQIDDNDTPLADGNDNAGERIDDNDTPLVDTIPGDNASNSGMNKTILITAVGAGCAILLVATLVVTLRRRKGE